MDFFWKKTISYESESGDLPVKQFHEATLILHQKRFLRESGSEMFLRESGTLPNAHVAVHCELLRELNI
jgi:hypothetical protein